jgi:hypothetical protein
MPTDTSAVSDAVTVSKARTMVHTGPSRCTEEFLRLDSVWLQVLPLSVSTVQERNRGSCRLVPQGVGNLYVGA